MATRRLVGRNTGRNSDSDWNTDREPSMREIIGTNTVQYQEEFVLYNTRTWSPVSSTRSSVMMEHLMLMITPYSVEPLFTDQISCDESLVLYISNTICNASC